MSQTELHSGLLLEERDKVEFPSLYKVLMHNDDYSTMQFVVAMLVTVFKKKTEEAEAIMLDVHKKGFGLCGLYSKEIAETKVMLVHEKAKDAGYPLRCSMEKE